DFVSDDRADAAIVDGVDLRGIEERRLKDASGKVNRVALRILVSIDGRRRHAPLVAVRWFSDLSEPTADFEAGSAFHIAEKIIAPDFNRRVVAPAIRITDLVDLGLEFGMGELFSPGRHPGLRIDFLMKCGF